MERPGLLVVYSAEGTLKSMLPRPAGRLSTRHGRLPRAQGSAADRGTAHELPDRSDLVRHPPRHDQGARPPVHQHRAPPQPRLRHQLPSLHHGRRVFKRQVITPEMLDVFDYFSLGDKEVPPKKLPLTTESPDSVSSSYGYKAHGEHHYHTLQELIQRLVHTTCAGGSYLLNCGPMGNGKIDPKAVELFTGIGDWIQRKPRVDLRHRGEPAACPARVGRCLPVKGWNKPSTSMS